MDSHEGERIVAALADLGARVSVRRLPAGDYLVAPGVLVERKSVRDLHLSVVAGRFWRQIGKLRAASQRRYLLIEGLDLYEGPLSPNAVRGTCIAVTAQAVSLLWSRDVEDSASWLVRLAMRWSRTSAPPDRPRYDQTPGVACDPAEAVLAAVHGVSVKTARDLLDAFGSIAAVIEAGPAGWSAVRGIGPARTAALQAALRLPRASRRSGEKVENHRPAARSAVETGQPVGTRVACSSQAEPRHLGGDP